MVAPEVFRREGVRLFWVAHAVAVGCLFAAFLIGGVRGLTIASLLGVLEVAVSFDNAIVNAAVLARMGAYWQRLFLTAGILVAAVGMRLLVPLLIVCVGAGLGPASALRVAFDDPSRYHRLILASQPGVAAFGGVFLLMIFLGFAFEEHDREWIGWVERPLRRLGRITAADQMIAVVFTLAAALTVTDRLTRGVTVGALAGLLSFQFVSRSGRIIAGHADADGVSRPRSTVTGRRAFFLFCYLELLDATFSFDSVMGGFSVTFNIAFITIGMAIGAAYIRALTVYVVRRGTLEQYRYLEHGAYYAIGMLAVLLMVEVWWDVPDVVTAAAGAGLIVAAVLSSVWARRRQEGADHGAESGLPDASVHSGPGSPGRRFPAA